MHLNTPILKTIAYYIVAAAVITYVELSGSFKSGPCTPNLDVFLPLLFFIATIVLTGIGLVKAIRKGGEHIIVTAIHGSVLFLIIVWLIWQNQKSKPTAPEKTHQVEIALQ